MATDYGLTHDTLSTVNRMISETDTRERLIGVLVEREIKARVDMLDNALQKRTEAHKELAKIDRPDVEHLDVDGRVTASSYTKARVEELKKGTEKIAKLENAIEKALAGDFGKLKELK